MELGQLELGTAFRILVRTAPILLLRLTLYFAFWLLSVLYLAVVGGVAYAAAQLWPLIAVIVVVVAIIVLLPLYRIANRYVFYLVKAAHLAVIVQLLEYGHLPQGASQLGFGKDQVASRFGEVSAMFLVDELVAGVIRGFTKAVTSFASWIPGDAVKTLAGMASGVIRYATTYVDEAILARAFLRKDETVWQSAWEGIVLYGMVWRPLLLNAIALMALSYIPFVLVLVLLAAPMGLLLGSMATLAGILSIPLVLLFAVLAKKAVGDSFAMIAMVAAYLHATQGLAPDPAIDARISGISKQFSELRRRAFAGKEEPAQASSLRETSAQQIENGT